jgi:UDP-glucose 4-epimerase
MSFHFVAGGAGFIGSALVRRLLEEGARVRVADDFSTGFRQNLSEALEHIELLEGDLVDPAVARCALEGVDYVLHQAAIPSVQRSVEDPLSSNRANVTATLNILVAARDAQLKRPVYAYLAEDLRAPGDSGNRGF